MGATLHLHIGLPKTASSWLQAVVFPELSHLEVFDRPRLDAQFGARAFGDLFRLSATLWDKYGESAFRTLLESRSPLPPGRDFLISDEAIGRGGSRSALLATHIERLGEIAQAQGFERLHVLCLIRRQDHWLASHYAQMSDRASHVSQRDFEDFVRRVISPRGERYGFGALLDYHGLHARLARAADAVPLDLTILPYEWLKAEPAPFLNRVLDSLGAPVSGRVEPDERRANVRSQGERWMLRPRRMSIPGSGRKASLPLWADPPRRRGITIPPALSAAVLESYERGNRLLAETLGWNLAEYGYWRDGEARAVVADPRGGYAAPATGVAKSS